MERATSPPRFAFGRNWRGYVGVLGDERVNAAERSLEEMLGPGMLRGASAPHRWWGCNQFLFRRAP